MGCSVVLEIEIIFENDIDNHEQLLKLMWNTSS